MHSRIMKGGSGGSNSNSFNYHSKITEIRPRPPPPRPAQHNHLLYPPSPEEKNDPQGADPMTSHNRTI